MLYLALLPPVVVGGIFDLKKGIIPNILTFPLIATGLLYSAFTGDIVSSMVGFLVSFIIGYAAFYFGGMGGGDVKLIAGLGAWLGLQPLAYIMFFGSVVGLIWFGIRAICKKGFLDRARSFLRGLYAIRVTGLKGLFVFNKDNTVPYGTCIAVGYIIVVAIKPYVSAVGM